MLVVPAVLALGYGIFFRTKEIPPHGIVLSEPTSRRLWALAREIAAVARTKDVDEIRLVPEANARSPTPPPGWACAAAAGGCTSASRS